MGVGVIREPHFCLHPNLLLKPQLIFSTTPSRNFPCRRAGQFLCDKGDEQITVVAEINTTVNVVDVSLAVQRHH